jgi:hypothetical protein
MLCQSARTVLAGILMTLCASTADAGPMLAPISGVATVGGPGDGDLADTFNQAGLSAAYTTGITDFDAFLAGNPTHTSTFPGYEWFSERFATTASVTYDFGGPFWIDRLALWNEESSGAGVLNLLYSLDGLTFTPLATGLAPRDNPALDANGVPLIDPPDYLAEVFGFRPTLTRYVRFDMSGCAQRNDDYPACAIGEVAFSQAVVPEPATMLLVGGGLAGLAARVRRSRRR